MDTSSKPTIVVTVDGSDKDERALAVAASLAELADAAVRVVRVFSTPIDGLAPRAAPLGVVDAARTVRADVATAVRQRAEQLAAFGVAEVTPEVLDGVDVGAVLIKDLEATGAAFIVMATRAAGAMGRAIQGSVADHLVRESPRPVLVVPPRASYMSGNRVTLRRVLVPLDGSSASLRVIPRLLSLAHAEKLEFVLLQVVRPERVGGHVMPPGLPTTVNAIADDSEWTHVGAAIAEQRLGGIADRLRARGSRAEVRVIEAADPDTVIVDAIRNELVELIAMSTRGASGLRRLVLGSVAERVVKQSEVPVLLVTARSGGALA
jgi:nucleotide-binding universal stress UspA family protein